MTPRERVLAAMKQESLDRPPVAIFTQSATIGQMEKVGAAWPEAHKDANLMAKLGAAQADVFGFECVRAPFCLTAEAERLGCTVQVTKKDASPMLKEHPHKFDPMTGEYDEPNLMDPAEFVAGGRPAEAIKAMEILKKSHGENYCLVAGNTGPFTLTGHLVNTENMVFGMMMAPEEVSKWVDAVSPICKAYTQALSDAGADVIQMSEPSASTDMIAPDMFQDAAGKYISDVLASVKDAFSVLHICGDTAPIIPKMIGTGVTGLSIEEKVNPDKAVDIVAGKAVLVGNVGSVRPLFQGTPEEVAAAAKHCVEAGFNVISSGCGIGSPRPTPTWKPSSRPSKAEGRQTRGDIQKPFKTKSFPFSAYLYTARVLFPALYDIQTGIQRPVRRGTQEDTGTEARARGRQACTRGGGLPGGLRGPRRTAQPLPGGVAGFQGRMPEGTVRIPQLPRRVGGPGDGTGTGEDNLGRVPRIHRDT